MFFQAAGTAVAPYPYAWLAEDVNEDGSLRVT